MALDNIPSPTANSYSSLADAKAYWDLNRHIDYSSYTDRELEQALIFATATLDVEFGSKYAGELYDESYALFWPRTGVYDSRGIAITDYTTFPTQLAQATACFAFTTLLEDRTAEVSVDAVVEKSMDGLGSVKYDSYGAKRAAATKTVVPNQCAKILGSLITSSTSSYVEFLSRG